MLLSHKRIPNLQPLTADNQFIHQSWQGPRSLTRGGAVVAGWY
jgi:hypothetical protein